MQVPHGLVHTSFAGRASAADPPLAATSVTATRRLLTAGLLAGPIYVGVGALEVALRPGFDVRRHVLSQMANGDLGWIHMAMMAITGLLTAAGALGLWRALRGQPAGTWGPILLAVYGLGVACAAFFTADPALGFPPGTAADERTVSWHGGLHMLFGSVGFLGLIAASGVFARRFARLGQRRLAAFSIGTGLFYLSSTLTGVVFGAAAEDPTVLAVIIFTFTAAVVVGWTWISTIAWNTRGQL